jgi:Mn-containing catalase
MTREMAHQQSFEKALYSLQPNFPPGKLAGMSEFTNVYYNMSTGDGDSRGPWNKEPTFDYREASPAVDGGDGMPTVALEPEDMQVVKKSALRLQSDLKSDPTTGAMLGMAAGKNGATGNGADALEADPQAAKHNAESQTGRKARTSKHT